MKKLSLVIILFTIILFTGCSSKQNQLELQKSKKYVSLKNINQHFNLMQKDAKYELSNKFFVYLPAKMSIPVDSSGSDVNLLAVDRLSLYLLNKYNGDILTNVRIETDWLFTIYWNTYTYYITADVWKRKEEV
ncbi:MAG: hypothetical protein DRG78_20365 [Epsilonproteobacteria bacterium]|nr:MAG: hypothetical protein DRG78_20365 [Campylobacterota bacterium]